MKKDLKSFYAHDKDYGNYFDLEKSREVLEKYKKENFFEKAGFKKAIENIAKPIKVHVDIGAGTGWLVIHTSPLFEKVIAVEPSKKALGIAAEIASENQIENIEFLNADMVEAIKNLNPREPIFLTTATVFSHIRDFYVKEFLRIVNNLPQGSVLFFDEPYEKNIRQRLWYIRSKEWWAANLKNWNLIFFDIPNSEYVRGIYAELVGKEKVKNFYQKNTIEKMKWWLSGGFNIIRALKRKIRKI